MSGPSRRNFLVLAGAGAAAAGVAGVSAGTGRPAASVTALPKDASGALVAHIADVTDGELSVLVGDREVVVHDPDLVARLARVISGARSNTHQAQSESAEV